LDSAKGVGVVKHTLDRPVIVEHHLLLARQVHGEALHGWLHDVHGVLKNTPCGLCGQAGVE
jgi:hypothetical protein